MSVAVQIISSGLPFQQGLTYNHDSHRTARIAVAPIPMLSSCKQNVSDLLANAGIGACTSSCAVPQPAYLILQSMPTCNEGYARSVLAANLSVIVWSASR